MKKLLRGFMKLAFEMGSGATIYTTSLVKIDLGISSLQIQRQQDELMGLLSLLQNKELRLK
jgi:hypothetical protein